MTGLVQAVSPTVAGWLVVAFCFVPAALYGLSRLFASERPVDAERARTARPRGRHTASAFPEDTGQVDRRVVFVPGEGRSAGNGEPPLASGGRPAPEGRR